MPPRDRRAACLVAAATLALLLPGIFFTLPPGSGKGVEGAWRTLNGEVPYRDFWSMYAPGQIALSSWLLRTFGREVLVVATAGVALRCATAGLIYSVARRAGASGRVSAALGLLFGASFFELSPEIGSYPPALFLIVWALWNTLAWFEQGSDRRLWHAGLLLGMAALFKHDVAAYWMLGTIAALWIAWVLAGRRRPAHWAPPLRSSWILGAGGLALVAPVALGIALTAGRDAWQDLFVFPAGPFRLVRAERYPGLLPNLDPLLDWLANPGELGKARGAGVAFSSWMLGNAPQAFFVVGLLFLLLRARALAPERLALLALLLSCLPFFWLAAHVQQNTHLTTMALCSLLTAAILLIELGPHRPLIGRLVLGLALFHGAGLLVRPAMSAWLFLRWFPTSVALGLPGTAGVRVTPGIRDELVPLVELVRAGTTPRERIHVGVLENDAVVVSNPRFYWLCERRAATRYSELHPAVTDRESVQREMIADLEGAHVRCAVIWTFGLHTQERIEKIVARRRGLIGDVGSGLLDRWFDEHFEPILVRGEYAVWWRKGAPRPSLPSD